MPLRLGCRAKGGVHGRRKRSRRQAPPCLPRTAVAEPERGGGRAQGADGRGLPGASGRNRGGRPSRDWPRRRLRVRRLPRPRTADEERPRAPAAGGVRRLLRAGASGRCGPDAVPADTDRQAGPRPVVLHPRRGARHRAPGGRPRARWGQGQVRGAARRAAGHALGRRARPAPRRRRVGARRDREGPVEDRPPALRAPAPEREAPARGLHQEPQAAERDGLRVRLRGLANRGQPRRVQ